MNHVFALYAGIATAPSAASDGHENGRLVTNVLDCRQQLSSDETAGKMADP